MKRLLALAAGIAIAGCAAPMEPPSGYVPVQDAGGRRFLAVSARGNTLSLTDRPNEGGKYGDLGYWVDSFKHEKVKLGAYRLAAETDFKFDNGKVGKLLDLRMGQGSAEYTWLVVLSVDAWRIVTVEAGGPSGQIQEDRSKLEEAIRKARI